MTKPSVELGFDVVVIARDERRDARGARDIGSSLLECTKAQRSHWAFVLRFVGCAGWFYGIRFSVPPRWAKGTS